MFQNVFLLHLNYVRDHLEPELFSPMKRIKFIHYKIHYTVSVCATPCDVEIWQRTDDVDGVHRRIGFSTCEECNRQMCKPING